VGEGGPQAARRRDAAGRHAATRRDDLRARDHLAGNGARHGRPGTPEPGASASSPSEPSGICECHSRSPVARHRRRVVAAARRLDAGFRQHRRRAGRVTASARALPGRR
jgi:hypothetical protein